MIKSKWIYVCIFFLIFPIGCIVDGQSPICYDGTEPVRFNVVVLNNSDIDKTILLVRTNADSEEFEISANSLEEFADIICIDKTWRGVFGCGDQNGGMKGESDIKLVVGEHNIDIGKYSICVNGLKDLNPTSYGEFITGKLKGIKSGVVKLKLTIAEDGNLTLEYLSIPRY